MSNYFPSRSYAGQQLLSQLTKYVGTPTIVIALSDGGVQVAQEIAQGIGCKMTMLLLEPVSLPGEPDAVLSIREDGKYTYNDMWSAGQLEEFEAEYRTYLDQAKQQQYSHLRNALGVSCLASSDLLNDKHVVIVSDAMSNGSSFDAAIDFLKPVRHLNLVAAVPLVTSGVLDKMRLACDEVYTIGLIENYLGADHYYQDNTMPSHEAIVSSIESQLFS